LHLPTTVTITAPECLSLQGVRGAVAKWLSDDPREEVWGELLDRVERAVRYRGPTAALRQMEKALDEMTVATQKLKSEGLDSIVAGFAAEETRARDLRSSLLATVERRGQLIDMYVQLCCRVAPPG
jgi:hypothetical protein